MALAGNMYSFYLWYNVEFTVPLIFYLSFNHGNLFVWKIVWILSDKKDKTVNI